MTTKVTTTEGMIPFIRRQQAREPVPGEITPEDDWLREFIASVSVGIPKRLREHFDAS